MDIDAEVQAPPGGDAALEVIEHVRQLVASFRAVERVIAQRFGVNQTDSAAMELLARHGPLTPGRLAQHLGVTKAAVTFVIDRLETSGHVRREPNPADRRSSLLRVAPDSVAAVAAMMRPIADDMRARFQDLPEHDRALVLTFLDGLGEVFARAADRLDAEDAASPTDAGHAV